MSKTTPQKTASRAALQPEKLLLQIAQEHLLVETLETRKSDSLDFHDVSVWGIKSALIAAYQAGRVAGQKAAAQTTQQAA